MSFNPLNYVSQINGNYIVLQCDTPELQENIRSLGAKQRDSNEWFFLCDNENHLLSVLSELRDLGFSFVGGAAGWPPAAIFEEFRERGLLKGKYQEILWQSSNQIRTFDK